MVPATQPAAWQLSNPTGTATTQQHVFILTRASCRRPAAAAACCCTPPQLLAAAAAAAPPRRLSCARAAGAAADVLVALARLKAARHRACRLRAAAAMLLFAANPNGEGPRLRCKQSADRLSVGCRWGGLRERCRKSGGRVQAWGAGSGLCEL